jgi:Uma2 family endonuclease
MTQLINNGRISRRRGEPAWEVARMFPMQGEWTEEDYLNLDRNSENRMMELDDGFLEFLPMPDPLHQRIVGYVYRRLYAYGEDSGHGEALMAPCPIRLWPGQMREPDIFFVKAHRIKNSRRPPEGADLAIEVPSPGKENRERDLKTKRRVYAKAKIAEYWIIDPERETITVFVLSGKTYKTHGVFKPGEQATSKLLPGFALDVAAVFAAGEDK